MSSGEVEEMAASGLAHGSFQGDAVVVVPYARDLDVDELVMVASEDFDLPMSETDYMYGSGNANANGGGHGSSGAGNYEAPYRPRKHFDEPSPPLSPISPTTVVEGFYDPYSAPRRSSAVRFKFDADTQGEGRSKGKQKDDEADDKVVDLRALPPRRTKPYDSRVRSKSLDPSTREVSGYRDRSLSPTRRIDEISFPYVPLRALAKTSSVLSDTALQRVTIPEEESSGQPAVPRAHSNSALRSQVEAKRAKSASVNFDLDLGSEWRMGETIGNFLTRKRHELVQSGALSSADETGKDKDKENQGSQMASSAPEQRHEEKRTETQSEKQRAAGTGKRMSASSVGNGHRPVATSKGSSAASSVYAPTRSSVAKVSSSRRRGSVENQDDATASKDIHRLPRRNSLPLSGGGGGGPLPPRGSHRRSSSARRLRIPGGSSSRTSRKGSVTRSGERATGASHRASGSLPKSQPKSGKTPVSLKGGSVAAQLLRPRKRSAHERSRSVVSHRSSSSRHDAPLERTRKTTRGRPRGQADRNSSQAHRSANVTALELELSQLQKQIKDVADKIHALEERNSSIATRQELEKLRREHEALQKNKLQKMRILMQQKSRFSPSSSSTSVQSQRRHALQAYQERTKLMAEADARRKKQSTATNEATEEANGTAQAQGDNESVHSNTSSEDSTSTLVLSSAHARMLSKVLVAPVMHPNNVRFRKLISDKVAHRLGASVSILYAAGFEEKTEDGKKYLILEGDQEKWMPRLKETIARVYAASVPS